MLDQLRQLFEEAGFTLRTHEGSTEQGPFECVGADGVAAWNIFKRFALIPTEVDGDDDLLLFTWSATSLDFRRQIAIYEEGGFDGLDHTICNCRLVSPLQLRSAESGSLWSHKIGKQRFFRAVEDLEPFKAMHASPVASITIGLEH